MDLRDVVTFPTAVIALVIALYSPLNNTIRKALQLDNAVISGALLTPDVLNIANSENNTGHAKKGKFKYIYLLKIMLTNDGYTLASLHSNFQCLALDSVGNRLVYNFNFYDEERLAIEHPELSADNTAIFIAKFNSPFKEEQSRYRHVPTGKCAIPYMDKYGIGHAIIKDFNLELQKIYDEAEKKRKLLTN